ncbi:CBY1-interacting BAR domain-containing protein 1-like [Babylonia areolata]|uniref:CBY1-interacting BAR domain-containing protein 1-like n=1 Tax=Babylonia areolata TaxID=304850 RepID=UPI003FCFAB3B
MSRTGAEIRASESESKTIQDRLTAIERHLGQLCDTFGSYTRKTARLRDKGDLLCREIAEYAEYEKWNPSLRKGMTQFAESLSAVQDYREAQVNRLEKKVVSNLSGYGLLCKQTKNDLKGAFTAQSKEAAQKKKVDQMKLKAPQNKHQITHCMIQAERELQKLSVEASRSQHGLEQQVCSFEGKKVGDMKRVLREFVNIELVFHAKALELYTQCFQSLSVIDPDGDLEEFKRQIQPANTVRKDMARTASQQSLDSRNSNNSSSTRPVPRPQSQPQPPRLPVATPITNGVQRQTLEDDSDDYEDDDDDDEDDDDDDDDDDYTEGESTARSTHSRRR